jgi:hypothetical protein
VVVLDSRALAFQVSAGGTDAEEALASLLCKTLEYAL